MKKNVCVCKWAVVRRPKNMIRSDAVNAYIYSNIFMLSVFGIVQARRRCVPYDRRPTFFANLREPFSGNGQTDSRTKINGQTPHDRHFDHTEKYHF